MVDAARWVWTSRHACVVSGWESIFVQERIILDVSIDARLGLSAFVGDKRNNSAGVGNRTIPTELPLAAGA